MENLKLRRTIAPLAAAAVTALGVGGVAIAQKSSSPTPPSTSPAAQSAPEGAEQEGAEQQPTGPAITRAKQAALAKVGGGKVTDVSAEKPDPNESKDAAEPTRAGEPGDPAYESKIAYDVEVTKADGSIVDVALDSQFAVLGTENASAQDGGASGERSSEVAGDDGPSGHADEPANPTADNQASGAQ